MEVVNIPDTVYPEEVRPQSVNIEVGWGSLRQNPERLAPQAPSSRHDEKPNQRREQRIGVAPAGRHRDDGSCNDPEGTDQVGNHLVVGALHVEGFLGPGPQQSPRDHVHHKTADRDQQHRPHQDLSRLPQAACRLDQHVAAHQQEQSGVGQRGKDLPAVETVGLASPRLDSVGRQDGGQRHSKTEGVGCHMAGIGNQRQRTGEGTRDPLDHHEADNEYKGDRERPEMTTPGAGSVRVGAAHSIALFLIVTTILRIESDGQP